MYSQMVQLTTKQSTLGFFHGHQSHPADVTHDGSRVGIERFNLMTRIALRYEHHDECVHGLLSTLFYKS